MILKWAVCQIMSSIIIFINFERKTSTATHIQKQQQQNKQKTNPVT